MTQRFANFASTTLKSPLLIGSNTLEVTDPGSFPGISVPDHFYAVLGEGALAEVIKVTGTAGAVWACQRGIDLTIPRAWSAGSSIELRIVAAALADLGEAASVGTQGPKGDKGDTGAAGPEGVQGIPGLQGADGAAGQNGAPGAPGADGAVGPKGDIGLTGIGTIYTPALNDSISILARDLVTWGGSTYIAIQDCSLTVNDSGINEALVGEFIKIFAERGQDGQQGPAGLNGSDGAPGADGAAGQDGAVGPQGPAGADGTFDPLISVAGLTTHSATEAALGSEVIANTVDTDFSGAGNWTLAAGWAVTAGALTHTANGGAGAATLGGAFCPIVPGKLYLLTLTQKETTFGAITITAGGKTLLNAVQIYSVPWATRTYAFTATTDAAISISGVSAHNLSIDSISLKEVGLSTAAQSIRNTDGSMGMEIRPGGSGRNNMFIGDTSGVSALGSFNIGLGPLALQGLVSGGSNVGIGYKALNSLVTSEKNVALGFQAGAAATSDQQVYIGYNAGNTATNGNGQIAIGSNAKASSSGGVVIGIDAGGTGASSVLIGANAGQSGTGSNNTSIGNSAHSSPGGAVSCVMVGNSAGASSTGNYNTFIGGSYSGYGATGTLNTALGYNAYAAIAAKSGTGNLLLGAWSGRYLTGAGSNNLFINNQDRTDLTGEQTKSLVWGTFAATTAAQYFQINGHLKVIEQLVLPKTSGYGIKVDNTTPTWAWRDLEGHLAWDDLGANAFSLVSYRGGAVREYTGGVGKMLDAKFHVPHDYVPGSDIFIHIHWSHNGTAVSGSFGADIAHTYAKGHQQAIFVAEKTLPLTYATVDIATTPQWQHMITEVQLSVAGGSATQIDTATLEVDGLLLANVTLTAVPTITGGSATTPFVHFVDLHYQSTGLGTKAKAPGFWT